jgi:anti-sigma regulatory factor (Ser/Thr protein kinase)
MAATRSPPIPSDAMPSRHPNAFETAQATGPFHYRTAPTTAAIRLARHAFGHWLHDQRGAQLDAIDDLLIASSELITNGVEHSADPNGHVAIRATVKGSTVVLEVENQGEDFARPLDRRLVDVLDEDEHGRGLFIVDALTDRVEVDSREGRTIVRCIKHGVVGQPASDDAESDDLSDRFRA